jgi:membrane fusion protein (multidrug efflux system)
LRDVKKTVSLSEALNYHIQTNGMKGKVKLVGGAILLILVGLVVWKIAGNGSTGDPRRALAPLVKLETPHRETVVYTLKFTGDVNPMQQANIYSKVAGNLDRNYVDIGTTVRENQLLALIDTTELGQQVLQTGATYENARLNYQRNKDLYAQNLVAKQDLDNAEAAMKVASANYEQAKIRLDYAHITAPFSGYITKRYFDAGANITSNDKILFTLMNADVMKVTVNVLEKDIPLISTGKKAITTVDAYPGKQFFGTVTRYSGAVDLSTRTMEVEIDIPNHDHLLKPGMFANVELIVDEHGNALTIPSQAILKDDKGSYVYTVTDNTAKRKNITAGGEQSSRMEIVSGLGDTDKIVTVGQQFVKDKGQVLIQQ